jgi:HEAT repeat protein
MNQNEIWKKLDAERGNRDPFTFDDPSDGIQALELLRPKVLETPDECSSDDWKFVFFYAFHGCLAQKRFADDACAIFARVIGALPMLRDGGRSFLEEIEKAAELAVKPLRAELEQRKDFALRVATFDLLKALDPSAPTKLSGVSDEARALMESVDALAEDGKTWRSKTAALLREQKIETLREAMTKAPERRAGRYETPTAFGLAVARSEIASGRPLSHEGKSGILSDLGSWGDDEIETTRDLLASIDEPTRQELLAGALTYAKNGNERKRCMQLAYMAPGTLPAVIDVVDAITIGKYDTYKKTDALRCLSSFGPSIAKTLAADLEKRSSIGAEIVANVLGELADPATAHALVDLLGHSAKPVRLAATASLKRIGAPARAAIEAGAKSKKKAIRDACVELTSVLDQAPSPAASLPETEKTAIFAALEREKDSASEDLKALGQSHGAALVVVAFDWARTKGAEDYYVRRAIVRALQFAMEKDAPGAAAAFVRGFTEIPKLSTYSVRDFTRAIRDDGKTHSVKPLIAALEGPAFPLRAAAFETLVELDAKADRELFVAALADASKEVRTLASECLEKMGGDPSDVAAHLASKNADTRGAAATLLAKIADDSVRAAIEKALVAEKKPEIASQLEKALAKSGGTVAAAPKGDDDEASIVALLESEKLAKMPKFLDFEKLPKLRLKSGRALDGKAMTAVVTRLMNEGPDQEDAVARRVRPFLDDTSANEVSNALREAWANDKRDSKHKWAVYQQAILADDARLNFIGPKLDELVSGGQHHLAGWYADVLHRHSMHGASRTGLSWLAHWSRAADTRSLKTKARELLQKAADEKKTTVAKLEGELNAYVADDVADASIPTLGFESGSVEIDKLTVRIGADLKLAHDKKVPAEAKEQLTRLKKQVSSLYSSEIARLEQAMISGRPWPVSAFEKLFLQHPLMKTLGERLVFCATHNGGGQRVLFRVAEATCVAADYAKAPLAGDAIVRIAHPLEMTKEELTTWGTHFSEAETMSPFPQIGRTTFTRGGEELLPKGKVAPATLAGRVRGLGWRNASAEDAGMVYEATKTFAGRGIRASMSHGGYHVADNSWNTDPIELQSISFADLTGNPIELEKVDAIVFSEVASDLRRMLGI